MFKGSKGFLIADFESRILLPFGDNADLTYYKPRDARTSVLPPLGHFQKQWIDACKNGGKTACDFEYSGNMIEQMLLGLVAYRVGKKIQYDGAEGRVTNCPEANELAAAEIPQGLDAGRVSRAGFAKHGDLHLLGQSPFMAFRRGGAGHNDAGTWSR